LHVGNALLNNVPEGLHGDQATNANQARDNDVLHDSLAFLIFEKFHILAPLLGGLLTSMGRKGRAGAKEVEAFVRN
jgi:hypothetical protein